MNERLNRYYQREEEFLEEFPVLAGAAAKVLSGEWEPNYHCNDVARTNQEYFLSTGELNQLAFDSAAVFHTGNVFSSVQIVLRSSHRSVTIRVTLDGDRPVAEKIRDRATTEKD